METTLSEKLKKINKLQKEIGSLENAINAIKKDIKENENEKYELQRWMGDGRFHLNYITTDVLKHILIIYEKRIEEVFSELKEMIKI